MTDPITDMFNRIRNAQAVSKETVALSFSNLKYEIAKILEKQGFIEKAEKKGRKDKRVLEIFLKTEQEDSGRKKIKSINLKRISKPGQRIYADVKNIKPVRGGYGMAVISTSKGLMTDKEARKERLGGEIICQVW